MIPFSFVRDGDSDQHRTRVAVGDNGGVTDGQLLRETASGHCVGPGRGSDQMCGGRMVPSGVLGTGDFGF